MNIRLLAGCKQILVCMSDRRPERRWAPLFVSVGVSTVWLGHSAALAKGTLHMLPLNTNGFPHFVFGCVKVAVPLAQMY